MIAVLAGQGRGCCLLLITLGAWKLVNNGNVYFPMSSVMRQVCKRRQLTAQFGRLFLPFSFVQTWHWHSDLISFQALFVGDSSKG